VNVARNPLLSLRLPVWRTRFVLMLIVAGFVGLAIRALYLQGLQRDFLQAEGESRYGRTLQMSAHRGMITDRNGEPLAVSTPVESVWISPSSTAEVLPEQRKALAKLLGIAEAELNRKIDAHDRDFAWLKRQLPPEQAEKVRQLAVPGVFIQREYRRYYPAGDVTSHILGYTDLDDVGTEGVELAYQDWLAGKPGSRRVIRDRKGRVIEDVESVRAPQQGRDLALSIDLKLQYVAYRELKNAVTLHKAKAASIVVLDVQTGEVLALANVPTYNPNSRGQYDTQRARNRAVVDLFEPGSTMKPFTVAAALDLDRIKPTTVMPTASGAIRVRNHTIRDAHPSPENLDVAQVIQHSSNVGTAHIAERLAPKEMWSVLSASGFGTVPRLGFPGETGGRLRNHDRWTNLDQATMSFGHGVSVSLMQLARAYTIFCSGGELLPVSLVKRTEPVAGVPVISARTSQQMRDMLQLVTQKGGTAPLAQVVGYSVGGKTGTAHKVENGGYAAHRYVASFVGFAPVSNPRLIVAVMVDEPDPRRHFGGQVAAPVVSAVLTDALRMLAIPPDLPIPRSSTFEEIEGVPEDV
jgi:cell division protein FtsI (penicillin-binding protein 3)